MRKKSTREIKLFLNFKIIRIRLSSHKVVDFDSYYSHSKCYIILPYIVAKFS